MDLQNHRHIMVYFRPGVYENPISSRDERGIQTYSDVETCTVQDGVLVIHRKTGDEIVYPLDTIFKVTLLANNPHRASG